MAANGGQLREFLRRFDDGADRPRRLYRDRSHAEQPDSRRRPTPGSSRCSTRDAHAAQAGLRVVMAQPSISSQLVDNLNASIHVRALLTEFF